MQDEWTKKERNKMQQGGGTTMSEEWRDAESLVAFVILQFVVFVLQLKNRNRRKLCSLHICHFCGRIFNLCLVFSVTKGLRVP